MNLVPQFNYVHAPYFEQYLHKFMGKIHVPTDFDGTLPLELWIVTSMVPSEIVMVVVYDKVSGPSKSVGPLILIVKLCI